MKKSFSFLLVSLCFLAVAGPALAYDAVPDWRGDPWSLYWHFGDPWIVGEVSPMGSTLLPDTPSQPPPFGEIVVPSGYAPGPTPYDPVVIFGPDPFFIEASNILNPNPLKLGRLQITYFDPNPLTYDFVGLWLEYAGPAEKYFFDILPGEKVGSGPGPGMYTQVWDFTIAPNPFFEVIAVQPNFAELGGPLVVDQIVLDTQCAVPVPGAVWLLGSGLVGLVGLRRKINK